LKRAAVEQGSPLAFGHTDREQHEHDVVACLLDLDPLPSRNIVTICAGIPRSANVPERPFPAS
jgi:hypothetical protein